MRQFWKENHVMHWLRNLICGIFIGIGTILPGVSGGVLAVIFDIYRPFMELLTYPKQGIKKYWKWIPPIILGWCIGFFVFAKGVAAAFVLSDTVTVWLFIGLIFGTLPALLREAGREGRSPSGWVSMVICALLVFASLYYVRYVVRAVVEPNVWWYNLCGALWGAGVVVPGMTSSSVMMALGLYEPLLEGLVNLDFLVLSACLPGFFFAMLLLARLVNWIFRRWYAVAFHGIVGIVLASTLVIIPISYDGAAEIFLSALCCAGGFLLAFFMERLDQNIQEAS